MEGAGAAGVGSAVLGGSHGGRFSILEAQAPCRQLFLDVSNVTWANPTRADRSKVGGVRGRPRHLEVRAAQDPSAVAFWFTVDGWSCLAKPVWPCLGRQPLPGALSRAASPPGSGWPNASFLREPLARGGSCSCRDGEVDV